MNSARTTFDPLLLGLLLSFVSAALYAVTNICLRSSVGHNDIWVTCLKTGPTAFVAAALLWFDARRGARLLAPWGVIAMLLWRFRVRFNQASERWQVWAGNCRANSMSTSYFSMGRKPRRARSERTSPWR